MNETAKNVGDEKPHGEEDVLADGNKESPANETEEKEPEDKVILVFPLSASIYCDYFILTLSLGKQEISLL